MNKDDATGGLFALDGDAPQLARDVWIAPGAQIIGRVAIGSQASVWFNAVIRGDNEPIKIGARTNIQDGAVLHSDPGEPLSIGMDCTIGHRAILHGCRLGDGVLVGMGATVLNNAEIGEGCLIGANALVTERQSFEPGTLILGAPARAARSLDDQTVAELRASAARYALNAERFQKGLSRP